MKRSAVEVSKPMINDNLIHKDNKISNKTVLTEATRLNNNIKCMYVNARSIMNKRDELELYLKEEQIELLAITETWLHENISNNEINFNGYNLLRKDRIHINKKKGGGVAFFVKNELDAVVRDEFDNDKFSECLFITVGNNNNKSLVGVCYRPPDSLSTDDEGLYEILHKASSEKCVIMGDFNFSELHWDKLNTISDEHSFVKSVNDNYLEQLVDKPTRGNNILDLILTNDDTMVQNVNVGEPFGTSDHNIIRFELIISCADNKINFPKYNYFHADYDKIRNYLDDKDWDNILNETNVNILWNNIKSELDNIKEKFVPLAKITNKKSKWVTREVIRCRRAKERAWKEYVRSGKNNRLFEIYKTKRNLAVKVNNKSKFEFEKKLALNIKKDCKSFYSYVRSKQRSKVKVGPICDNNGCIVSDTVESNNTFNKYFASVFTTEDVSNIPETVQIFDNSLTPLDNIEISEDLVFRKLGDLKLDKSPGPDGIHPKLLFELRNELTAPLTKLFNLSLSNGIMPDDWKEANIIPIFKKGKKDKCENYRPVSLTSIVCKIFESILKEAIVGHLDKYCLINTSQHGFTKGRSCLTNLLEFFEYVTNSIDKGEAVDLIYLDFAKAFDKVPHLRLHKKLESHGIRGNISKWIKNWLDNRKQRVSVDNVYSEWEKVTSGVPQGSVLGPVLFVIYINDLDINIISKINKFADDTKLGKIINTMDDRKQLQVDLDNLFKWSNDWQMKFNVSKCSVLHLGTSKVSEINYKLGDEDLKIVSCERDLGVYIDNKLKFSEQVNHVVKEANKTLGMIKRNIKCRNKDVIVRLYKALVRPKLDYCVQVWRPYFKKDMFSLEQVQHRATKLIYECKKQNYCNRLQYSGLMNLDDRRTRGDLIEVFKLIKGFSNVDYNQFFQLVDNNRTRGHRYKLVKNRCRTELRKRFFSQRVIDVWNKLPSEVVESDSVNSFKNRLDKVLNFIVETNN